MAFMRSGTKVGNAKLRSFNVTDNFMAVFKLQTLTVFIPPMQRGKCADLRLRQNGTIARNGILA